MSKKEMRTWMILILFAVISYWVVNNLNIIVNILLIIIDVLKPFILGGVLAFVLNIPMTKIENILSKLFKKNNNKNLIRNISITISLALLLAIIVFIAFLLIPELVQNIEQLIDNLPGLINHAETFIVDLLDKYPEVQNKILEFFKNSDDINSIISNILNYVLNGAIDIITNLISGTITLFTALIFAIYMLSQKEYLLKGTKKLCNAYLKKELVEKIMKIGTLANHTFSKFISGQCVEAAILGFIFFIVLSLFRFPYALIISVLTAVTALIPIFGALIAMAIGAILIAINNPFQAIIFIIVFQIIQQIEGNFIYPRVVGKSVGLSPMWTLLAITTCGSLFGIAGMIIGLPLASIIYALIKNDVNIKIKKKTKITTKNNQINT